MPSQSFFGHQSDVLRFAAQHRGKVPASTAALRTVAGNRLGHLPCYFVLNSAAEAATLHRHRVSYLPQWTSEVELQTWANAAIAISALGPKPNSAVGVDVDR